MAKNHMHAKATGAISAQPRLHQRAGEIQAYGTVSHLPPLELEEPVRLEMTAQLNQLLADTMTVRDLYKKLAGRPQRFINCICFSISITMSKSSWLIRSPNGFLPPPQLRHQCGGVHRYA